MRPLYVALFSLLIVFTSCNNNGKKDKTLVPNSVGNINALQVIIPNELWSGPTGEAIREHFAAPADGLPQDEPLFTISQMIPETFVDFVRTNRIFLYVGLGEDERANILQNEYAKPQTGAIIRAASEERLIELINENAPGIIQAFNKSEIKERQRRTNISAKKVDSLKKDFGISMKIPSAYRLASSDASHYWYRKDLKDGEMNILIYQVPLDMISSDSTAVADIVNIRDSVGSQLIPVEDDDLFITEDAYAPHIYYTTIDDRPAYETKGIWELATYYMAGPFINYAVRDVENNRYLILEGFVYAPMVRKRNLQFELESILLSTKFE